MLGYPNFDSGSLDLGLKLLLVPNWDASFPFWCRTKPLHDSFAVALVSQTAEQQMKDKKKKKRVRMIQFIQPP